MTAVAEAGWQITMLAWPKAHGNPPHTAIVSEMLFLFIYDFENHFFRRHGGFLPA
jgi:hypothetical protein